MKISVNKGKQGFKNIVVCGLTSLLIACGGSGGGGEKSASVTDDMTISTTLSGTAIKGTIENGIVKAYLIENQAGEMIRSTQVLAGPVRTDAQGEYQLSMGGAFTNRSVVVEITADANTRMTCDVTEGCGTNEAGQPISYGDQFELSSQFSLEGMTTGLSTGDSLRVHLSPLTHMAVSYAQSSENGLTSDNIENAISHIEDIMELDQGAMALAPADITRLESYSSLTKSEIEMGVVSAAFLSLVNTSDWNSIDEVLNFVQQQMENTGQLSGVSIGSEPDISLDEIFSSAHEIIEDLVQAESGGSFSEALSVVNSETAETLENITNVAEEITPVIITAQPSGQTVSEGASVTLSVSVTGGGTLSYQWRKDQQFIAGETSSSLSLSRAELVDEGTYDVVVSNNLGSEISLAALVVVNELVTLFDYQLSWNIPEQREDESELELFEIDGYIIVYGTNAENLNSELVIDGASITSTTISELSSGTYYFAISTVDSDGVQGEYSELFQGTI